MMRNRRIQRQLRREQKDNRPWLNHEGYRDPTAYEAIRNVTREEKAKAASKNTFQGR